MYCYQFIVLIVLKCVDFILNWVCILSSEFIWSCWSHSSCVTYQMHCSNDLIHHVFNHLTFIYCDSPMPCKLFSCRPQSIARCWKYFSFLTNFFFFYRGNRNITLSLSWNIIPNAGLLPNIFASGSHSFKFPSEYTTSRM